VSRRGGVWGGATAPALALLAALAALVALPLSAGTALAAKGSSTASTPATSTPATSTPATSTPATSTPATSTPAASSTPLNVPGTTSPFSPGLPATPVGTATATTPTVTSASSSAGGGVSGSIAIAVGAIVVLIGVALFIWTDARRHAPVKPGAGGAGALGGRSGSKAPPKSRKLSPAERRRRKRGRAR